MKPIEVINAEQAKLKDAVKEAINSFEEATGLKISSIEYTLLLTKTMYDSIYYPKTVITYVSDEFEVFQA